jgi:hypothetical protein
MELTDAEIEQLTDEYINGVGYLGLSDRKAFLRVWRRVRRRFEAVWDSDEVDQDTVRRETARVLKRASETCAENAAALNRLLRKECARGGVVRLDDLARRVFRTH